MIFHSRNAFLTLKKSAYPLRLDQIRRQILCSAEEEICIDFIEILTIGLEYSSA